MTHSMVKFYEEIYRTRDDYKRDLGPMYENVATFLTFKPASVLDYGCGRGNLAEFFRDRMGATIRKYDPAIPELSEAPTGSFDLGLNTDVLEHVPEDEIDGILAAIRALCKNAFFNVHLIHAREILSNGENAHCTLKPPAWWKAKIAKHFGQAWIVPSNYPHSCSIITWQPNPFVLSYYKGKEMWQSSKAKVWLTRGKDYAKYALRLPRLLRSAIQTVQATQQEMLKLNDCQYRDLVDIMSGRKTVRHNDSVTITTEHPVAYDSPDHINPFGTIQDNTRNYAFYTKCHKLYGDELRFLDLGCSGGGLVFEFALNGHLAIGLEGSDRSQKMGRANWRTIPGNLFTCDIAKPFTLTAAGNVQSFTVISCWEVLEHIPLTAMPTLLNNVKQHLAEGGVFVGSISKSDEDPLHVTLLDNDGWIRVFKENGLDLTIGYEDAFEFNEYCRGIAGGMFDSHDYRAAPHKGLHFIARKTQQDTSTESA